MKPLLLGIIIFVFQCWIAIATVRRVRNLNCLDRLGWLNPVLKCPIQCGRYSTSSQVKPRFDRVTRENEDQDKTRRWKTRHITTLKLRELRRLHSLYGLRATPQSDPPLSNEEDAVQISVESEKDRKPIFGGKVAHRVLASAVYLPTIIDALQSFMGPLASRYPVFFPAARILQPVVSLYTSIPYLSHGVSSGIYYLFMKGPYKFPYFVKFNAIQALVMTTFQYALSMFYYRFFALHAAGASPYHDIALLTCVLACGAALTTSILQAAMGKVGHLPVISEAVRLQVGEQHQHHAAE